MSATHENLLRSTAQSRATVVRDVGYAVQLDLTRGDEVFGSTTTVRFGATEGDATFLDLTAAQVTSVHLNGRRLPDHVVQDTRISLPQLAAENEVVVVAECSYTHEGKGLHHFRDPADDGVYLHSQCEPFDAHLIFACFDQPDLKATFDVSVRAPAGWVVVSNEAMATRPEEGQAGTWTFGTTPRISTYLFAVVAGTYTSVHTTHALKGTDRTIDLGLYMRRSLAEFLDTDVLFDLTHAGFDWFGEAFDLPYPFAKYDQLFVPEFSAGAMENPGCVTFSESYVFRSKVTDAALERRAETLLHEMAHMWFGDLVTMRWWDDLWLNESFATFMSVLCMSRVTRFTNAWTTFLDAEKTWAKFQDQLPSTHPIAADMVDIESVHQNFDGITYAKGASVLRQLVAWVGQDEFLQGCQQYFRAHQWGNAELKDFLAALEQASGRDLRGWVGEWLETTGVNALGLDLQTDEDGTITGAAVVQTAPAEHPTLRRHRVAIGGYTRTDAGVERTLRIELDVADARTPVDELVGTPRPDVLLVNDDDLTYTKIVLDPRSLAALKTSLHAFTESLPRALAWSAAWDMVRDAEMTAGDFIELVLHNVEAESEVGVLQRLLGRALAAAERYGDPARRDDRLDQLAAQARAALDRAEPGSDHQLAWARHWASSARRGEQRDDVRRLLGGELAVDGLELDTDLRWFLVSSLAATGAVDGDRIDAELALDPTDLGERNAATARAAMPTHAAKEAAWTALRDDRELSHTMARQVMAGFGQLSQAEVLAPWAEAWFADLPAVWDGRSQNLATEWTNGTFPHWAASPALLAQVQDLLAGDLRPPARRAVLEQRDTLERTLRARAKDAAPDTPIASATALEPPSGTSDAADVAPPA